MRQERGALFLYAQSFLHPGAGSSTGVIDLPVQRESHSGYPLIPASSLKGSLRDLAEQKIADKNLIATLFGPALLGRKEEESFAGALMIGDGKILAFPVRSLTRTFFWISSPLLTSRVKRDLAACGLAPDWDTIAPLEPGKALIPDGCQVDGDLFLEEMSFAVERSAQVTAMARFVAGQFDPSIIGEAYASKLAADFAIVSDDDFSHLVRFATHVNARIKLTSVKTTGTYKAADGSIEKGNLWYEELLPPETIFYSQISANAPRSDNTGSSQDMLAVLTGTVLRDRFIQVGGNESLGQGFCAALFTKGADA